jgi:hypothetical protein
MIKKIALVLFLFFAQITTNCAVELALTNDIFNILNSKKICARISLNAQDQAIYANSLNFSTDCPNISITSWKCKQDPSMQYVAKFKHVKKVYAESLDFEIILNQDESCKQNELLKSLRESNLYFSCIVLDKNGSSRSASLVKTFDDGFSSIDTTTFKNSLAFDFIKTFTGTKDSLLDKTICPDKYLIASKIVPEPANIILDNLKDIWKTLVTKLNTFLSSSNCIFIYLIILALALLMIIIRLRLRLTNLWLIEIHRFLVICSFLWTYALIFWFSGLSKFISQATFFVSFAVLLVPISMYYIFTAGAHTTLGKLKSLIGFILASLILPLLIKAYFLFKSF